MEKEPNQAPFFNPKNNFFVNNYFCFRLNFQHDNVLKFNQIPTTRKQKHISH